MKLDTSHPVYFWLAVLVVTLGTVALAEQILRLVKAKDSGTPSETKKTIWAILIIFAGSLYSAGQLLKWWD